MYDQVSSAVSNYSFVLTFHLSRVRYVLYHHRHGRYVTQWLNAVRAKIKTSSPSLRACTVSKFLLTVFVATG